MRNPLAANYLSLDLFISALITSIAITLAAWVIKRMDLLVAGS